MPTNPTIYKLKLPGKIATAFLMTCFFCLFFSLMHTGTVHADTNVPIDNHGPETNSGTTSGGADFTPITGVGQGAFNGQLMWYKVYVRNGLSTYINVTPTCNDRIGTPTVDYSMDILNANEYDYGNGPFGGYFDNGQYTQEIDSSSCSKVITFHIPSDAGIAATGIVGHEDYRVFGFYAQIETIPSGSQEQYFTVTSTNSSNGNSYVGLAKPDITNPTLGGKALKFATVYKTSGTWSTEVMFAPQCFQDVSGKTFSIQIKDPDNGVYQFPPNYMYADLQSSPGSPPPWTTIHTWDAATVQGGPFGVSGTTGTLSYSGYDSNHIYKLRVIDSTHPNTIQIKLPFDQFDSKATVRAECNVNCQITTPASGAILPENQDVNVYVKGTPASQTWVAEGGSGFWLKRIGSTDSESNYKTLTQTQPGSNLYRDTVHPDVGITSVTYTYGVYYYKVANGGYTGTHCSRTFKVAPNPAFIQAACDYTTAIIPTSDANYGGQFGIQWLDSSGNPVGGRYTYSLAKTASGTTKWGPKDTFNTFGILWPHNAYSVQLYVLTTSGWPSSPQATDDLDVCLDGACGSPPTVEGEVGQTQTVNYVFNINNQTLKQFNSGYTATITTSGGISIVGPATKPVVVRAGDNDITVTFDIINNYDGSFSFQFGFNSSPISLSTWSGACGPIDTQAFTLPYSQLWNGDLATGGGFGDATGLADPNTVGACADTFPYISASASPYSGGIVGFGEEQNYLGSQVDFGAVAMGLIPGGAGGPVGYFSGSPYPHTPETSPKPIFANTGNVRNASNRGGYLNGSAPYFHCVKDYYDDTQSSPGNSSGNLQSDINTCGLGKKCQYKYLGDLTIGGANLPVDANGVSNQVTLYVDGNVTISGNIKYPSIFDASTPDHMPYLTIIAKGNIILTDGVTQLDGLYIAQPTNSGNGAFATCNNGNDVLSPDPAASQNPCNSQLVVNGAVIAQHVELLRSHGTLHQPPSDVNGVGANPAEIFNFVPSMVIGTPAFPASFGQAEGLYNLPPVF